MTLATVQFPSKALERPATYIALLPDPEEVGPGPYPVLMQLHGYWDDERSWLTKSMLLEHVKRYPLIVVLPGTANGWWSNLGPPNQWEDYVVKDLRAHVHATLPAREGRWALGGLSMGGFGALRLGLKHPGLFCSVFAHSSAIPRYGDRPFVWDDPERSETARERLRVDLDCYHWARNVDRELLPRLSFDCGVDDFLIEDNRVFDAFLTEIGLPHRYEEHPGAHTWDYWNLHVQAAIAQHAEVLGIERAPERQPAPPAADGEES